MIRSKRKSAPKKTGRKPFAKNRDVSSNSYYRPRYTRPTSESIKPNKKPADPEKDNFSWARVGNVVVLSAILMIVVFATTLSNTSNISLKQGDVLYRPVETYESAAQDILGESVFNKSKLFFRSSAFEDKLSDRFPELDSIDALVPLGGRDLSINISTSTPFAQVSSGSDKAIISEEGILVSLNSDYINASSILNIRFAEPQSDLAEGSRIVTASEVELLSLLQHELSTMLIDEKPITINEVLFSVTDGQLEVSLVEKKLLFKLSTYTDAKQQIGSLVATIEFLNREGQLPSNYIDVRVPGRVFVK